MNKTAIGLRISPDAHPTASLLCSRQDVSRDCQDLWASNIEMRILRSLSLALPNGCAGWLLLPRLS